MNSSQIPIARKEGLVVQEMPGEVLIYDLDENKAFSLNSTASTVWKSCDGRKTVSEIAASLNEGRDQESKESIVWLALDQLKEKNLLSNEVKSRFEGQTRREVLKKVGLATAIALPVIAMLSFPTTALSATCAPSACGTQNSCIPGQICCPRPSGFQCVDSVGGTVTCGPSTVPASSPC